MKIKKRLKEIVGWVSKDERHGLDIDYDNSWIIGNIKDRVQFITFVLRTMPNGSIWDIESAYGEEDFKQVLMYQQDSSIRTIKRTTWPRMYNLRIEINEKNLETLIKAVHDHNLVDKITHQNILFDECVLFSASDCLENNMTWISKKIPEFKLRQAVNNNLFLYSNSLAIKDEETKA